MDRIKRALTLFVASAVAALGLVAVASPASASFNDCTNDGTRMCIWQGANGTGARYEFGNSVFPGCVNIGGSFHSTTSSMKMMRLGAKVKFYWDANCVALDGMTTYFFPVSTYNFGSMNEHVWSFYWTYS